MGLPVPRTWGRARPVPSQVRLHTLPLYTFPQPRLVLTWVPKAQQLSKLTWHFGKCPLQMLVCLGSSGVRC